MMEKSITSTGEPMSNNNKPTHNLVSISGEGDKAKFTTIAALWETKEGIGYTGEIPAGIMLTGRVGIFPRKEN
jgi:hypothetical protein